jgi:hypothetical protein
MALLEGLKTSNFMGVLNFVQEFQASLNIGDDFLKSQITNSFSNILTPT